MATGKTPSEASRDFSTLNREKVKTNLTIGTPMK
jgi:hypothetical protein